MSPVEICFGKDHSQIEANQSANINFVVGGVKDETTLIHIKGKQNGGEVVIEEHIDNQTINTTILVRSGQINKQQSYRDKPIIIIGHGK